MLSNVEGETQLAAESRGNLAGGCNLARISVWILFIGTAALQNYFARKVLAPDIVSYMEVARHGREYYPLGISPYWSPLYPWLLFLTFRGMWSPVVLLRLLNVLTAGFFLWSYERFLLTALSRTGARFSRNAVATGYSVAVMVGAGSTFLTIGGPDIIAAGLYLLLCAVVLRGTGSLWAQVGLGTLSGLAYFAKTAMFPVCGVLLGALWLRDRAVAKHAAWLAPGIFGVLSLLVALPVSMVVGHASIGEASNLNAKWLLGGAAGPIQSGEESMRGLSPAQAVARAQQPTCFGPMFGDVTYAPWFDPAWWYGGEQMHITIRRIAARVSGNVLVCLSWLVTFLCPITALSLRRAGHWRNFILNDLGAAIVCMWSLGCIALFFAIDLELRYVAGATAALMTFAAIAGLQATNQRGQARVAAALAICAFAIAGLRDYRIYKSSAGDAEVGIARALKELRVRPGERVLVVGNGMSGGFFLAGVQICCNLPGVDAYRRLPVDDQGRVLDIAARQGATSAIMLPVRDRVAGWNCRPALSVCALRLAEAQ